MLITFKKRRTTIRDPLQKASRIKYLANGGYEEMQKKSRKKKPVPATVKPEEEDKTSKSEDEEGCCSNVVRAIQRLVDQFQTNSIFPTKSNDFIM